MNRLIAIAGLVVALVMIVLTLSWCSERKRAAGAEAAGTLSDGRTAAAQDASAVRDGNDVANTETRNEVKDAQDEVRQADPAHRDRIARQRLCRLNPGACPA